MLDLQCECGRTTGVPDSFVGESADCDGCGRRLNLVAGEIDTGGVTGRLFLKKGPQRQGEQFLLAGRAPIEIGKLSTKPIALPGTQVSRSHARLARTNDGWQIEDQKSTNGVFVNGQRVATASLRDGDLLDIGEYEFVYKSIRSSVEVLGEDDLILDESDEDAGAYDLAEPEPTAPVFPARGAARGAAFGAAFGAAVAPDTTHNAPALVATGEAPICPCCFQTLPYNAKVCISCGIRIPSGRPIITSRGMEENDLAERARNWIQVISVFMPLGLIPIASEAFGTKRARAVWVIVGVTILASIVFFVDIIANSPGHRNLLLWVGSADARAQRIQRDAERQTEDSRDRTRSPRGSSPRSRMSRTVEPPATPEPAEDFHLYQLLTAALLHGGILHLAGNMVFLIVFGLRVNEVIGDLQFAIVYPILAIASAVVYMAVMSASPLHAMLGASGAIMGLAGMYFVFFPVQHVHMAFWVRIYIAAFFHKLFRMRGVWLLVLWIGFNDVLPMVLASRRGSDVGASDGVAHWAHLGGFLSGVVIALALLLMRFAAARGGDILSVALGRYAWPLVGKPSDHVGVAVVPTAFPAERRVLLTNRRF